MSDNRLRNIDVAKGLLVIMVLFYHLPVILIESSRIDCDYFRRIGEISRLFTPFFMPAFFVITGYCSNFEKKVLPFLKSQITGLIIPMLTLNIFPCILCFNIKAFSQFINVNFWLWGLSFWFLPCLLLSKLFFYLIYTISKANTIKLVCIVFLLMLLGVVCDQKHWLQNYWYWRNALVFGGCILFGQVLRRQSQFNRILLVGTSVYILTYLLLTSIKCNIPSLGLNVDYSLSNICLFVPLCLGGSCCIFIMSKIFEFSLILSYIGKGSIIFYCLHWMIAQHIGIWTGKILETNNSINASVFFFIVLVITVIICIIFIYLFNLRYIRVFIGKRYK